MSKFVGTWTYDATNSKGDTARLLRLAITDASGDGWGTAMGTGWTPVLQVKRAGGSALVASVTGAWEDATEVAALFSIGDETTMTFVTGTTTLVPLAGAAPNDYEGLLILTKAGEESIIAADELAETYGLRVQRWP